MALLTECGRFGAYAVYRHTTPHGVLDLRSKWGGAHRGGGPTTQHIFERTLAANNTTVTPSVFNPLAERDREILQIG